MNEKNVKLERRFFVSAIVLLIASYYFILQGIQEENKELKAQIENCENND